ncbi:MAG TPA: hypothetical protein VNO14_19870 [Blastocatellia bacterium]|nr:hypothetical protein [Blastocatellia bacterium]
MTLSEAIAAFLASSRDHSSALDILSDYSSESAIENLRCLTGSLLRDFLARWYVEKASANRDALPAPSELLSALASFVEWADEHARAGLKVEWLPIINELAESLPRALDIYYSLSEHLAARGGAFVFPEFLASFEEGGRGLYDIDAPGEAGAREGYFRILSVQGGAALVEDLLTEEVMGPVLLPYDVASLAGEGYILNLELVRCPEGWQVTGSGFAYPPGTELE